MTTWQSQNLLTLLSSSGENRSSDYTSQTKKNESSDNVLLPSEDETDSINVKSKINLAGFGHIGTKRYEK